MKPLIKITEDEAMRLLKEQSKKSYAPVAAKWEDQWYDIRGFTKYDLNDFVRAVGAEAGVEVDTQPTIEHNKKPVYKRVFSGEDERN